MIDLDAAISYDLERDENVVIEPGALIMLEEDTALWTAMDYPGARVMGSLDDCVILDDSTAVVYIGRLKADPSGEPSFIVESYSYHIVMWNEKLYNVFRADLFLSRVLQNTHDCL